MRISEYPCNAFDCASQLTLCLFSLLYFLGMPDDTTILALHVVGRDAEDYMDNPNM